ncbi:MAG: dihydrodipicolinate synthase family protein [Phycisphaerae bacterium]
MERLTGLIAAPFTPLAASGEPDLSVIPDYAGVLKANGLRGAFVGGTTGESLSLTVPEREALAEAWAAQADENFAVLVHVGGPSLPDCRRLADHARRLGITGFAAMGPNFFTPRRVEHLVDYCREIADAGGQTPFYYYHIPSRTGVYLPLVEFLRAGAECIPTLAGAKFTHEDLMDFIRCTQVGNGRFDLLFGRDEFLLAGLALGSTGAVGTTYNLAPALYQRVFEAFATGDFLSARAAQAQAAEMMAVYQKHGGLRAGKEIMKMLGVAVGPPRKPVDAMSAEEVETLRADLQRIGFFEYALKGASDA